jgi:uncharacterized membrane protein YbaN (DUF454 family)
LKRTTRVVVDWVVGLTLIAVGIAGGFIPILQGWPFVIAGLAVLSSHSRWANAIYQRMKKFGRQVRDRVLHRRDGGGSDEN